MFATQNVKTKKRRRRSCDLFMFFMERDSRDSRRLSIFQRLKCACNKIICNGKREVCIIKIILKLLSIFVSGNM